MKKLSLPVFALIALGISGCDWEGIRGNGHVVTDQRTVQEFTELDARGGFNIEWRSGPRGLTITTDENLLSHIEARNVGNRLELRTREHLRPSQHIKVAVSSATRSGARLSGATNLKVPALTGAQFALETSGASDVTLDGALDELLADMTGASELRAKSLQARTVQISTTGAASAQVNATETLRVAITGAGDVSYFGNPKNVEKHVTGAGSIRHRE